MLFEPMAGFEPATYSFITTSFSPFVHIEED